MTNSNSALNEAGRLREEAATWFARMRGPDAETHRALFEAWLAHGEAERAAYNRISEVFSIGKGLKSGSIDIPTSKPRFSSPRFRQLCLAAVLCAVAASLGWLMIERPGVTTDTQNTSVQSAADPGDLPRRLSTRIGDIRRFALSDGSTVILDTDSRVLVSYTTETRQLRLERGRARFEVAHERRPFVVAAGNGIVTAHGTIFDVRLTSDTGVTVRLLRGAVDVDLRSASTAGIARKMTRRLHPGEALAYSSTQIAAPTSAAPRDGNWPEPVRDLDQVRLADLIAEANRYSTTQIDLASPELGDLRVSGTFRLADTSKLATNLGTLLGLSVDGSIPTKITLGGCSTTALKNCRQPS